MKILRKKNNNNQDLPTENDSQDFPERFFTNPSYFEVIDGVIYEDIIGYVNKLQNDPKSRKTPFEKELGSVLEKYVSAKKTSEKELQNSLLNAALEHAQNAKTFEDCKWPYDDLLNGIIKEIQEIISK